MPKNSRPDIQVLEDRVKRLRNQLLEYKGLRLYGATKRRLSSVSEELEECMLIIHDIVNESPTISSSEFADFHDCPSVAPSEFSYDDDLMDVDALTISSLACPDYSARDIVSTYSARINECASSPATGVLQINQFCHMLHNWYQYRFTPPNRNPKFFFKATRIHEWIDLLIIASGHAMHENRFPKFKSDLEEWASKLDEAPDDTWVLPYSVLQYKKLKSDLCTREAVLIERVVKPKLYSSDFYPDEMNSVERIVIDNSDLSKEDLEIDKIVQSCSRLVITSTFDITKYQEVS